VVLPEFLIIGAPKCGTTSLAAALARHSDLFIPERKEPSFFDVNWDRGFAWFERYFEPARPGQLRGEATPQYFATPIAAQRIAKTNASCKLIVVARDPVLRAHSHYWFRRNSGREQRTIDDVMVDELRSPEAMAAGYLLRHGMYGENLSRFREWFAQELVHVLGFDELVRNSSRALSRCQTHLGVEPRDLELERTNAGRKAYALPISRAIQRLGRYQGLPKRVLRRVIGESLGKRIRRTLLDAVSRPERNPPLEESSRSRLRELYADDSARFQRAVGRPLWDG
jgi:hypothetical protein